MKKIICAITLILALTFNFGCSQATDPGLQSIRITQSLFGECFVEMDVMYGGKYCVRKMEDGEQILQGEKMIDDDSLGKYRYVIELVDTGISDKFRDNYKITEAKPLKDVPSSMNDKINIRYARADDSTVFIYIGSDDAIELGESLADFNESGFDTAKISFKIAN